MPRYAWEELGRWRAAEASSKHVLSNLNEL